MKPGMYDWFAIHSGFLVSIYYRYICQKLFLFEERLIKYAPIIDLTLDEMNNSLYIEDSTDYLLERITV